jgi:DNA-binding response OmpR family regulator
MALGATDYLNKPLKAALLIQKIRKCLQSGAQETSIKLPENAKATAKIPAELFDVSDDGVTFDSKIKFNSASLIQVESPLLKECDVIENVIKIDHPSETTIEPGLYRSKAKFLGLTEGTRTLINAKTRKWHE